MVQVRCVTKIYNTVFSTQVCIICYILKYHCASKDCISLSNMLYTISLINYISKQPVSIVYDRHFNEMDKFVDYKLVANNFASSNVLCQVTIISS